MADKQPNKLATLIGEAESLKKAAELKGAWAPEDVKAFEAKLKQIDEEKIVNSLTGRLEEIKDLAHSSGGSTVRSSFNDDIPWRTAGPNEGVPDGEAIIRQDWKSGDLVPENEAGERQVNAIKSGLYKDALNRYLRSTSLRSLGVRNGKFELKDTHMKVLSEGTDTAGGFWVVPEFNTNLVKKIATMTSIRPNATAITVGSDLVSFPKVVYTTDDKYTSGVRFAWTAEAPSADISESTNPSAGRVNIPVYTATAAIILTRANMEDAQFDLLGLCAMLMGEAFALGENDAYITGDGVGKPQGFTIHANAATASSSGGMYVPSGVAGALDWGIGTNAATKGLTGLEAALPPQYDNSAKWYMSKATKAAVRALVDGTGRPIWGAGEAYPNMGNDYQPRLLGRPVVTDQFMPAIASNALSIAFGDMAGYWITDRVGVTIEVLRELRALRDEVVIYARRRLGGQLVHDWRVKLGKCSVS